MIREKLPDAAIGIFIHATFPSSEIFRCLQSKEKTFISSKNKLSFCFNPFYFFPGFHSSKPNSSGYAGCKLNRVSGNTYKTV